MIIRIDHKLRIAGPELPPDVRQSIQEALSIPNLERQKAMEQDLWGWRDMPETIPLWSWDESVAPIDFVMPRGFRPLLLQGLEDFGISYEIKDHRVYEPDIPIDEVGISLRPWQKPATRAIRIFEQGIWKAPPGSGKTVAVLEAIRRSKAASIVVTNTKDILYQWRDRAREFLGEDVPVALIGDGRFEQSDFLTIATAQTLNSRFDELESTGFFDQFSFMCLDECHHATATTYRRIIDRFSSRIRIGVSATPDKTGDFELALNILGPIFHETRREDVESIVQPQVFKIPTRFTFAYREREGRRPSNYPELLQALITDPQRNALIVKSLQIDTGAHALVISKRLEHLDILATMLMHSGYPHAILMLTGEERSELRRDVAGYASRHPCVIFSTLADEALDIPRLDSIYLVFPQRNPGLIEQQVGRICRAHPDKMKPIVFDFADGLVGPLDAQWRQRRLKVYEPHHFPIIVVNPEDILNFEPEDEE